MIGKLKTVLALVAALVVVAGAASSVSAEHGKPPPGRGGPQISVHGVISAIDGNDQGSLITLHRDDGDVQVQVTAGTRIVPPGATPAVGDTARVVAQKPKQAGDPLLAVILNLADGPRQPGDPPTEPRKHVCGTIAALPADPHDGTWTVSVPKVADYALIVTADTAITPPDATPQVGGGVCFEARQTDQGWLALSIHLNARPEPGRGMPGPKMLVIHGTVVGPLPADRSGDWTLELAVAGAENQLILVTKDTRIAGDLAEGAKVMVHAHRVADAAGTRTLVADKIAVGNGTPGQPKVKDVVRIEGVVKAATDTAWTITTDDSTDVEVGITADTAIVGLAAGESPVGREVKGMARRAEDGSLVALIVRLDHD